MSSSTRSVVIAFGRFNPPTSGHKLLFDAVMLVARRLGADVIVYPSVSHDTRSNPLSFEVKVKFLQKLFPRITFNANSSIHTPFDAFKDIASRGYNNLYVVMGGDERTHEFEKFSRYFKRPTERDYDPSKHIPMGYQVIGTPRTNEKTVSGTAQRARAAQNDFAAFLHGSADSKRVDVIRDLFAAVRRGMNMHESHRLRTAVAHHSFRMSIVEQLNEGGYTFPAHGQKTAIFDTPFSRLDAAKIFYKTLTQKTPPNGLYTPEDIVNDAITRVLTASNVRLTSSQWNIAGEMLRKMDQLGIRWNKSALRPMIKHALKYESTAIDEADGVNRPKSPSEVDRLKTRQNQEKIELQRRQSNELLSAKLRDVQLKSQEQQRKASAPKPAATKPKSTSR